MIWIDSSRGYKFSVGGKDGWVLNPSESYNHWAERNRFQVNDTLFFKLKNGNDSVLVVTREKYNRCNGKKPIKTLTEGKSEYIFGRSGPHYFISSSEDHCKKGQKLVIVVLAVRPKKPSPSPASPPSASPTPSASIPAPSSKAPSPSPSDADVPSNSPNKSFVVGFTAFRTNWLLSFVVGVGVFMFCFG
uniref:Phytocyanin domain-containing protein n=2 Tax=Chenopodium quinoa TaxID=63459 RepID=A0A803NA87_CHEQI